MQAQLPEWEYMPDGWAARDDGRIAGWDTDDVVAAEKATWPSFIDVLNSTEPLAVHGVSTVPDLPTHNVNLTFGYVLALASAGGDSLKMLDWGCSLGQYYAIARAMWPQLRLDYTGVDLPKVCSEGQKLSPEARFVADESWRDEQFGLVMANGALHYVEDWPEMLRALIASTRGYLLITQLPVVDGDPYVYVQRPYAFGYNTEYLSWALSRGVFLGAARSAGAELVREFIVGHRPPVVNAPEQCEYRGFLFKH